MTQRLTFISSALPWPWLLLLLVLAVALGLRLHGVNWDAGHGFHPDERSIYMRAGCMYDVLTESPGYQGCIAEHPETEPGLPSLPTLLDADRSPLNPHWFPLGSILIYVLVFFRSILELFGDFNALDMRFVGRPLSALADAGSVFLVYLLGQRMYGRRVGLLAAALTALAVIHIQNSHFYRPETFSVVFTLASFWAALRMVEKQRLCDSALLGVLVGLAVAPKVSVLPLVLPLALAYGYRLVDSAGGRWPDISPQVVGRVAGHTALAGVVALAVFFGTTPYALLDFRTFVADLAAQTYMARNAGVWPFTIQYIDTPPFLYQFHQTAVWGLGLPLGLAAWLGIPFTAVMALARRDTRRADLLLLAWVFPSLLFLESFEVRFQRYFFPLMPFMVLMGSRMLLWLVDRSLAFTSRKRLALQPQTAHGHPRSDSPPSQGGENPVPSPFGRGKVGPALSAAEGMGVNTFSRRVAVATGPVLPWLSLGLVVLVVGATAFYALAFQKVYAREHPAVAASQWINANVPPGTAIVSDNHWDEFIPDLYRYDVWQFPVYEPDSPAKMDDLAQHLAGAEYLVFYSHRPYSSVARAPDRFPRSFAYYRQLFSDQLGYRLERAFTSYPELLGVAFRDDPFSTAKLPRPEPLTPGDSAPVTLTLGYADDNVVGYDHPQVLLFRNVERLSERALQQRLVAASLPERAGPAMGLMMSAEEKAVQRSGGTWSEIIHRDSWTNRLPVLAWLLAVELAYLAALPLAMFVFRPLPDRGIVLARMLGLLGVGYLAWLLASLGWVGFSRTSVLIGFLAVGLLSALVLALQWREIKSFLGRRWRLLLLAEALFLVAFLAFVAIRAANPDLWHPWRGGEKPMELAYLNAVVRSTTMPPYDPWFAGGYMNYYYWGYFIPASLIRVTGILPTTAFNLAVPLFFALTFTGAYSLVYNLAEGTRRSRAAGRTEASDPPQTGEERGSMGEIPPTPLCERGARGDFPQGAPAPTSADEALPGGAETGGEKLPWGPVGAGLVAGLFLAVIGNLDGIVQIAQGVWSRLVGGQGFPAFDFWRSSRMLPDMENFDPSPLAFWVPEKIASAPAVSPHITEFPFFTFLFADLHPHMMVIPFTLLVIGLGLSLAVGFRNSRWPWAAAAVVALALAVGALWAVNSWDYPPYLLLTLALVGLAVYFRPVPPMQRLVLLGALGPGVIALSVLAFLPFHQSYETFNAGLEVSRWRTPVDRYLGIHGLFLFIVVTCLIYYSRGALARLGRSLAPRPPAIAEATASGQRGPLARPWATVALGAGLLAVAWLVAAGYWTAALLLGLLILTGLAARNVLASEGDARPFAVTPLALLGLALAISIGVDLVRVEGDIGRMNTFFKYYLEVWVLLSLASGYMLWRLAEGGFLRGFPWGWGQRLWLAALALLLLSTLIYTGLGTRARLADRFNVTPLTLDGTAYMDRAVHQEKGQPIELKWDLEAIQWLQNNVTGSPVVLEAHTDQYRWGGRIANYTGLPTVLGWPWHQIQQRMAYNYAIGERARAVQEIYNTTDLDRAEALLRDYEVEYIIVGELERIFYSAAGLQKFSSLEERGLVRPVFQNDGVLIYQSIW